MVWLDVLVGGLWWCWWVGSFFCAVGFCYGFSFFGLGGGVWVWFLTFLVADWYRLCTAGPLVACVGCVGVWRVFWHPGLWGCGGLLVSLLGSGGWSALRCLLLAIRVRVGWCWSSERCAVGAVWPVVVHLVGGCGVRSFVPWAWSVAPDFSRFVCLCLGLLVAVGPVWFGAVWGGVPCLLRHMSWCAPGGLVWLVLPARGLPVVLGGWFDVVLLPSRVCR